MTDRQEVEQEQKQKRSTVWVNRRLHWDAIAAIVASLIGFLALLVGGYTAYVQHRTANIMVQQTRAAVWPHLQLGESDFLPGQMPAAKVGFESHGGYLVAVNKGVGPAIVKSVEVELDGKPQRDWDHVLKAFGFDNIRWVQSALNHKVVAPGEKVNFFVVYGKSDWLSFKHEAFSTKAFIRICYCSTLGECWTNSLGVGPTPGVRSVATCPQLSKAADFHG